eukprot:5653670-Pleurochrysis_carterae.AAC.1
MSRPIAPKAANGTRQRNLLRRLCLTTALLLQFRQQLGAAAHEQNLTKRQTCIKSRPEVPAARRFS